MPLGLVSASGTPVIHKLKRLKRSRINRINAGIILAYAHDPIGKFPHPGIIVFTVHKCIVDGNGDQIFPGGMVLDHHRAQVCKFIYCHGNMGFKMSVFTGDNYQAPVFQLNPDNLWRYNQGFGQALQRIVICLRSRKGAVAPLLI
jgi:hypothetical protein